MSLKDLAAIANSEAVFAVLFIVLGAVILKWIVQFIKETRTENTEREQYIFELHKAREDELRATIDETKKQAAEREDRLMKQLEKSTDQQQRIASTLTGIQVSLEKLEHRMESNFHAVWRQMGKIEKKQESEK